MPGIFTSLLNVAHTIAGVLYDKVPDAYVPREALCGGALCKFSYMKVMLLKALAMGDASEIKLTLDEVFKSIWGPSFRPQLSLESALKVRDVLGSYYTGRIGVADALKELVTVRGIDVASATEALTVLGPFRGRRQAYIVNTRSLAGLSMLHRAGLIEAEPEPLERFRSAARRGNEREWVELVEPFREAEEALGPLLEIVAPGVYNTPLVLDPILYLLTRNREPKLDPDDLKSAIGSARLRDVVNTILNEEPPIIV